MAVPFLILTWLSRVGGSFARRAGLGVAGIGVLEADRLSDAFGINEAGEVVVGKSRAVMWILK